MWPVPGIRLGLSWRFDKVLRSFGPCLEPYADSLRTIRRTGLIATVTNSLTHDWLVGISLYSAERERYHCVVMKQNGAGNYSQGDFSWRWSFITFTLESLVTCHVTIILRGMGSHIPVGAKLYLIIN